MSDQGQRTYKIGQAAQRVGLEPYVLRFWETEFPQLQPIRTPKGQRLYTEAHLRLIARIKALLYEHGLTIDGARRKLDQDRQWLDILSEIHDDLLEIRRTLLSGPVHPESQKASGASRQSKPAHSCSGQKQGDQNRDQQTENDPVDHGQK
jgi:DNA-binding transcriptional MerR regulator